MKSHGKVFIPGNVPSLKNSKIKTKRGVFHSKTVTKYLRSLGIQSFSASKKTVKEYITRPNLFLEYIEEFKAQVEKEKYPLKIGIHFVRGTRHKFDFHNAVQIIADLLVAHNIIEDDNMDYFLPFPLLLKGNYYSYDKENPGVYLKIL